MVSETDTPTGPLAPRAPVLQHDPSIPRPGSECFPPSRRLRRRAQFQTVQQRGQRGTSPHFVVFCQSRPGPSRLGITASRKVGGAVVRGRVKRLVREIFRRRLQASLLGDAVVIARTGAGDLTFQAAARELEGVFARVARRAAPSDERS